MTTEISERPATPLQRLLPIECYRHCDSCTCESCSGTERYSCFCPYCTCSSCSAKAERNADTRDTHLNDDNISVADEDINGKRKQKSQPSNQQPPRKRIKPPHATTIWDHVDAAALDATDLDVPPDVSRFCQVSLAYSASDCLRMCHVVPWTLDEDNLAKLEFAWGLPYRGLYLHSRYNIMTLTTALYGSFIHDCWALLPMDHEYLTALVTMFDSKGSWRKMVRDNDRMTKIYKGAKSFRYLFLPLAHNGGLRDPVIRRNLDTWAESLLTPTNCKINFFPYQKLPVLVSHVQPHYAIFSLGSKLQEHNLTVEDFLGSEYAKLRRKHLDLNFEACIALVSKLYKRWTIRKPPRDFAPRSDGMTEDSDLEDDISTSDECSIRSPMKVASQSSVQSDWNPRRKRRDPGDENVYPDDSLTAIMDENATAYGSDYENDAPDDFLTDDESNSLFNARLNGWVSNITSGLSPPPPSPASSRSGVVPASVTECDSDGDDVKDIGLADMDIS
ncbi:hypothetical protein BDN70DRAFT_879370 [Pholiota conissans]|uniref:HNH nuclease domain-containing protein n=1 Tax=Pholiota conissans TaxID=109636 RepID=A0A9P5Z356_9AGAR|nr:hypothetical protein BDN70DRAFT_879370 [Pholiota conissans]